MSESTGRAHISTPAPVATAPANAPAPPSIARQPRLLVLLNGQPSTGFVSATIASNGWNQSDTFSAVFALTPADPVHTAAWWDDQQDIQVEIRVSIARAGFTSLILGNVDTTDRDPATGLVTVSGRDLSSVLIEAPTAESFTNRTSSEIATLLAARHGLTASVTATTTPISRFFELDKDHATLGRAHYTTTEWDLLSFLAKCEGFDLHVAGKTLHFEAPSAVSTAPWIVRVQPPTPSTPYTSNVSNLRLVHHKTQARAVTVEVRSYSAKTGATVKATATAGGSGAKFQQDVATRTQVYRYVFPNLSQSMAQQRANSLLTDLKKHERSLTFDAPGDLALTPRNLLSLTGTGTVAAQNYFADTISRTIDYQGGFSMNVSAKTMDQRNIVSSVAT